MMVTNKNGYNVDFDAAVELMDDELREMLCAAGIATEQDFFTAYETEHAKKYGEEWELSKSNPTC